MNIAQRYAPLDLYRKPGEYLVTVKCRLTETTFHGRAFLRQVGDHFAYLPVVGSDAPGSPVMSARLCDVTIHESFVS